MYKEGNFTTYQNGERLFRQNEVGGTLFIIKEGNVKLSVLSEETGKESVVAKLGPGSIIGIMSFLQSEKRNATGIASGTVVCHTIDEVQRNKLLKTIPKWFTVLVNDLCRTLRELTKDYSNYKSQYNELETKNNVIVQRHERIKNEFDSLDQEITKLEKRLTKAGKIKNHKNKVDPKTDKN